MLLRLWAAVNQSVPILLNTHVFVEDFNFICGFIVTDGYLALMFILVMLSIFESIFFSCLLFISFEAHIEENFGKDDCHIGPV